MPMLELLMSSRVVQLLIILSSAFISSPSFVVFARPLDRHSPKTCVFNLSASIQRSNEILSFDPQALARQRREQPPRHSTANSSSVLSLKLYSRDTLLKTPFKTYRELTLSRTQREKARLNFIYNKLNHSKQTNSSTSDPLFTPVEIQAPVTSDIQHGSYVAEIGFGTPVQRVQTLIDTGSDVTWVPTSIFDPSASQTYEVLTCDAPLCQKLADGSRGCSDDQNCLYGVGYGDGSTTAGYFGTDTLQFGDSAIPNIPFGFDAQREDSAGLLGLGRGQASLPSLQGGSSFSYCLLDGDSTAPSTLDVGPVEIPSGAVTAHLLQNDVYNSFYYVDLMGMSVGGEQLQIPASAFEIDQQTGYGGVIVDSGTTLTYLFPEVYNSLRDAFVNKVQGLTPAGGPDDVCYQLTSELSDLPAIDFHFGEQTLSLSANTYLSIVDREQNIYCFAFAPTAEGFHNSIIGNIHQQELLVTYDLKNNMIGFSQNPNCQG